MILPSAPPEASCLPSRDHATTVTAAVWPSSVAILPPPPPPHRPAAAPLPRPWPPESNFFGGVSALPFPPVNRGKIKNAGGPFWGEEAKKKAPGPRRQRPQPLPHFGIVQRARRAAV